MQNIWRLNVIWQFFIQYFICISGQLWSKVMTLTIVELDFCSCGQNAALNSQWPGPKVCLTSSAFSSGAGC